LLAALPRFASDNWDPPDRAESERRPNAKGRQSESIILNYDEFGGSQIGELAGPVGASVTALQSAPPHELLYRDVAVDLAGYPIGT